MIYTKLTVKAMNIAYQAHHGQTDKSGCPYVFHPFHLAEHMQDEFTTCVALLHDVVEDTDMTIEKLAEDFPEPVIEAIRLLTHEDGVDYFEYVRGLKGNDIAKAVKLADLAHNSDQERCKLVNEPQERTEGRMKKYEKAKQILLEE